MSSPRHSRTRSLVGGSVGNLVEWYDWYVYSAFALYFADDFFPRGDATAQLLNTAGIFAIGFLMRPVGSLLLGAYADRHGRRAALTLSVLMMCAGSLLVALTPSYAEIGVGAPLLLLVARLVQGLSVGGEYGASATYMSEMARAHNRGLVASFQYVTLIAGQLLALGLLLGLQATMPADALEGWGWRIPFAVGALFALVALWLRRGIEEKHSFEVVQGDARRHLLRRLLDHPRQLLTVLGLTMGGSLAFYTYTTYMQKFLVNTAGWSKEQATLVSAAALLIYLAVQPLFGALSDRVGRRPLLIAFGIGGVAMTVPLMSALARVDNLWTGFLLMLSALLVVSCYTSISGLVKAELFPTEVRALGVGVPYAIAVSLFGGTAEYVALAFKQAGNESGFYWYVTACIAVSLIVYATMPDTKMHSAIREG